MGWKERFLAGALRRKRTGKAFSGGLAYFLISE